MGVHTGEATPVDDNYVALPLHQVARIAAGAHGGQILVSQATARVGAGTGSGGSFCHRRGGGCRSKWEESGCRHLVETAGGVRGECTYASGMMPTRGRPDGVMR